MSFLNSGFLWALPLGAIPIIIYYLMRFRSLKIVWGANYVLERALEKFKKKLYLDQLILIALRVIACLLAVIVFARPTSKINSAMVSSTGVHRVLIVDGSYSMMAGKQNQTRWDIAKQAMKQLVSTWGRGETWSLVLLTKAPEWIADRAKVITPEHTAKVIDALEPKETAIVLSKALEDLAQKFQNENAEFYLFADDQAQTWKGMEEFTRPERWTQPIYWGNPSLEDRSNLAVTSVRFTNERALVGHTSRLFITIRNFSEKPVQDAEVEEIVDGSFAGRDTISLLPGQEGTIYRDFVFSKTGSHYATARLGGDALEFDDKMSAGIEVVEKIKVLVLRNAERKGKFDSAWEFLKIFGRIETMADEDDEPMFTLGPLVFSLKDAQPAQKDFEDTDVVLVDGGSKADAKTAALLKEFLSRGGGLLLAADELVKAKNWNVFASEGLLPATLGRLRVETLGGDRFMALSRTDYEFPALRPFETDEDGDLSKTRFYSWYEFEKIPDGTEVLARFSNGKPFLLRKRFPRGNVLLMASGLNGRGNNLIVREFYIPLLFRIFTETAAGRIYPRTVRPNAPISLSIDKPEGFRGMTLTVEGNEPISLSPQESDGQLTASASGGVPGTGLGSILVVMEKDSYRVWYGVQGERTDSDLAPLAEHQKNQLCESLNINEVANGNELEELMKKNRSGSEWHHWVMLGLLLVLFGEMLMELRFV